MLSAFFICASNAASEPPSRPNVVLIISDDHGWSDYGFMGHPHIATPNLDRLAARSITFRRGYTPVPLCRPSLASIATGLYPSQHGVTGNDPDLPDPKANAMGSRSNPQFAGYYEKVIASFARHPNMVRDLTSRGYVALQTGKWWEGDPIKTAGFTHAMTVGVKKGSRHGDDGLAVGRQGLDPVFRFIDEAGSKPFFVWYAPMLPHAPHTPPSELLQKYQKLAPTEAVAKYWACVEWFDRTCGELFAYLDRKNLSSNTIVLYTADNGWVQDPTAANRPAARSKLSPYEGGVRTPIMISWPGTLSPRMDGEHLASNIDLWPTLAALLRTPLPSGLPGIDLTDGNAVKGRTRILGEAYSHNIHELGNPSASLQHQFIIDGWWKLVVPQRNSLEVFQGGERAPAQNQNTPELFDLHSDPWEKINVADKEPAKKKQLMEFLQKGAKAR